MKKILYGKIVFYIGWILTFMGIVASWNYLVAEGFIYYFILGLILLYIGWPEKNR